jgi:MoaA/NifB/PqqE/SkfB family radical SAM enzyme
MTSSLPTEAIISVTNRCDARCQMCNIWQLDPDEGLSAEDYRSRLPRSLREINLTGGEALLRKDIDEIAHALFEAGDTPRIVLATNGFRTDRTLVTIERIRRHVPRLGIAISLDGGEPVHDEMRGVENAYRRAMQTIKGLKALGLSDLRIGFTATPANLDALVEVYELACSLGVEFTATVAQNSEIYYATRTNAAHDPDRVENVFGELIRRRLRSKSPKNWLRAYFDAGVVDFVRNGKRASTCHAGTDFFFLTPSGQVHPCLTLPISFGNLKRESFEELWNGPAAQRVRTTVSKCQECWMMCTSRTELKRHPLRAASWVLRMQMSRGALGGHSAGV